MKTIYERNENSGAYQGYLKIYITNNDKLVVKHEDNCWNNDNYRRYYTSYPDVDEIDFSEMSIGDINHMMDNSANYDLEKIIYDYKGHN